MFEFGNGYYYNEAKRCADIISGVSSSRDPEVIKHVLDAYSEDYHCGLWLTGKRVEGSWAHPNEDTSFYQLKAQVMNIFSRLGLSMGQTVWTESKNAIFSHGIEVQNRGGKVLVQMGIVSRKLTYTFDIEQEVYFADINWKNLMKVTKDAKVTYKELSKFPAVSRDLALLIDKNIEFEQIEKIAYSSEKKLLQGVKLFDVYEGKNIPEGKKSYAVNFILQDETKTLNDKQIDAIMQKIVANLTKQLGAELR